jgi:hypothetical protein
MPKKGSNPENRKLTLTNLLKFLVSAVTGPSLAVFTATFGAMTKAMMIAGNAVNKRVLTTAYGTDIISDKTWENADKNLDSFMSNAFKLCFFAYLETAEYVQETIEDSQDKRGFGSSSDTAENQAEITEDISEVINKEDKKTLLFKVREDARNLNANMEQLQKEGKITEEMHKEFSDNLQKSLAEVETIARSSAMDRDSQDEKKSPNASIRPPFSTTPVHFRDRGGPAAAA